VVQESVEVFLGKYQFKLLDMQKNNGDLVPNLVLAKDLVKILKRGSFYTEIKS